MAENPAWARLIPTLIDFGNRQEYYDLDALDTTPEADKVSMALIYLTTIFLLAAIVLFLLKGKEYGVGMLS